MFYFFQYFYSIKDISIGGQCICYGHARYCPIDPVTGVSMTYYSGVFEHPRNKLTIGFMLLNRLCHRLSCTWTHEDMILYIATITLCFLLCKVRFCTVKSVSLQRYVFVRRVWTVREQHQKSVVLFSLACLPKNIVPLVPNWKQFISFMMGSCDKTKGTSFCASVGLDQPHVFLTLVVNYSLSANLGN